jgi:hypothetical protein
MAGARSPWNKIIQGHYIAHSKESAVYYVLYTMCPISDGFWGRAISPYGRATSQDVLTGIAKCIDVDSGISQNTLN